MLVNPPAFDKLIDTSINITSAVGELHFHKQAVAAQTRFLLEVSHARNIGFQGLDEFYVQKEIDNLILACNLVLSRICLTRNNIQISRTGALSIPGEIGELITTIPGTSENLDESSILALFTKIQNLRRPAIHKGSQVSDINLDTALNEFRNAMDSEDTVNKFNHLNISLELAANYDGRDRQNTEIIEQIATLMPPLSADSVNNWRKHHDVNNWRKLYRRSKHIVRAQNPSDANELFELRDRATRYLLPMRKTAASIILTLI